MQHTLTADRFEPHIDSQFQIDVDGVMLHVSLAEIERKGGGTREGGSFSLVFTTANDVHFEQGTYAVSNDAFGDVTLFLVPIGPFADGMGYEAVFT
ncbi:MAG: hypothetical protein AAF468_07930 [Pseudomonadota bacterium]